MAQLSDLQLASLLDEIAAAMRVGQPIVDAMHRLRERRLGRITKVAARLADKLERGEQLSDAIRFADTPVITQASAAVAACEKSGDPSLLSQVAQQLRARSEHSRAVRLTWLYPVILLAIAYIVAVGAMAPMVRMNNGRDFAWNPWVVSLSRWLETNWWIPPIVLVALAIIMITWKTLQRKMPHHVARQLFCQSLADQIEHGVPTDDAIRGAALMAGNDQLSKQANLTLESPSVVALLSDAAVTMPNLSGGTGQEILVARLRYASAIHEEKSRQHDYVLERLLPRAAMVLVGGGLTLAYAWWVIRPIYQQVAQW
ncbi:MAG: type II secretion system F family protein [Pirellulaceae bacterium]|nr:type II secretion system F family protein [Pirellulaceae bacterium]